MDEASLERVIEFHGHMCPGLALGVQAAELGLHELGARADDAVVTIIETDMCGVDAIQVLTGCTLGKGNLIHRDHGKSAFTFINRSNGRAVRVGLRAGAWDDDDGWMDLVFKMQDGTATVEERRRAEVLQQTRSSGILARAAEDIFEVRELCVAVPAPALLRRSIDCEECAEPTMETRIRHSAGRALCRPCSEPSDSGDRTVTQTESEPGPCACDGM